MSRTDQHDPDDHRPLELVVYMKRDRFMYPLPPSGVVELGRSSDSDVRVDHPSVSRRHLRLRIGSLVEVEDLGSSNGTSLFRAKHDERAAADETHHSTADRRIRPRESVAIHVGDMIRAGLILIELRHRRTSSSHEALRGRIDEAVIMVDPEMIRIRDVALRAATSDISVLLLGETGVGKEVMAELIHRNSRRSAHNLLRLNCAALSESLLEAELFGYTKGAFTGAHADKVGLLEATNRGTVLLDEVGELPPSTQAKLLRVLEERTVRRVGSTKSRRIDVRFITSTNRDLHQEIRAGRFRQDLFYRIAGVRVTIPPLRMRPAEIVPMAKTFLRSFCQYARLNEPELSPEAEEALMRYAWPGNVRELKNAMERVTFLCGEGSIRPDHLPGEEDHPESGNGLLSAYDYSDTTDLVQVRITHPSGLNEIQHVTADRDRVIQALDACAGNQTRAAKLLGVSRRTLVKRLDEYKLPRPKKRQRG